jgi:hypothetical protein
VQNDGLCICGCFCRLINGLLKQMAYCPYDRSAKLRPSRVELSLTLSMCSWCSRHPAIICRYMDISAVFSVSSAIINFKKSAYLQELHETYDMVVITPPLTMAPSAHSGPGLLFSSVIIFHYDHSGRSLISFNSHSGGWSPNWVHSARQPLIGLLYLPRLILRMENLVE